MRSWRSSTRTLTRSSRSQGQTVSWLFTPGSLGLSSYRACSVNLVNKDQLEILATLRESVNEDKAGLEAETSRLEIQIRELSDKNRMQLEQINGLLLEKVNLQSDGIGQRERMLQRERDIGYVYFLYASFVRTLSTFDLGLGTFAPSFPAKTCQKRSNPNFSLCTKIMYRRRKKSSRCWKD